MIPQTDTLGRHVMLSVQAAPQVRRAASKMVQKGEFGFETEQDVLRWCITRGIEELGRRSESREITGDAALLVAHNRMAKDELEQQFYLHAIETQESSIRTLVLHGRPDRAVQLAEMMWVEYDKVENPYWRGEFRTRIKQILDWARQEQRRKDQGIRRRVSSSLLPPSGKGEGDKRKGKTT